jgi:hypothetical protein
LEEVIVVKWLSRKSKTMPGRETLIEAYEVRAFRDESEEVREMVASVPEVPHAELGELESIKKAAKGHGEQTVLPDDCQFGDNDMCAVEE